MTHTHLLAFVSLLSVLFFVPCVLAGPAALNYIEFSQDYVVSGFLAFAHTVSSGQDAVSLFVQLVNSSLAFKTLLRLSIRKSFLELPTAPHCTPPTPPPPPQAEWVTSSSALLLELVHASIIACITFYYKYWFSCLSSLLDCELSWARSVLSFSVSSINGCLISVCWMND